MTLFNIDFTKKFLIKNTEKNIFSQTFAFLFDFKMKNKQKERLYICIFFF